MSEAGSGQYDLEYSRHPCFWGKSPAKYVRLVPEFVSDPADKFALDLGAGEGKNSLFLASLGYNVTAVEISLYACRNFIDRMIEERLDTGISLILGNALTAPVGGDATYDLIVAYGLLHCLPDEATIDLVVARMQALTKPGGLNVVSAFTDRLPIPAVQNYLSPTLVSEGYVPKLYSSWTIVQYEDDTLVETHPTSNIEHEHSLFRLIARRPIISLCPPK